MIPKGIKNSNKNKISCNGIGVITDESGIWVLGFERYEWAKFPETVPFPENDCTVTNEGSCIRFPIPGEEYGSYVFKCMNGNWWSKSCL